MHCVFFTRPSTTTTIGTSTNGKRLSAPPDDPIGRVELYHIWRRALAVQFGVGLTRVAVQAIP
jgi:hypothetical protein